MPAYRVFESRELMEIMEQPVERLTPFRMFVQDFPPSVVL